MKRILIVAFVIACLASCGGPTGIKDFVAGADSVAINFYKGDGTMDSVVKVVIIRDTTQVNAVADFVEATTTHQNKCGIDGTLHFFKKNMVLKDVDFRLEEPGCNQFSFTLGGKRYYTELSEAAKLYLKKLRGN